MTAPLVSARDITVDYPLGDGWLRAVNGISLDIAVGENVALVGESGCGKSTLGRTLLGIEPRGVRVGGSVLFEGSDLFTTARRTRREMAGRALSLIYQDPMTRLDPLMTVLGHFQELYRAHEGRVPRAKMRERAAASLAEVGVPPERLTSYPHELSGGMRQRVMIALALTLRPGFLVADEPTTSLDVIVEAQIVDLLKDLDRQRNLSILLITHNVGLVAEMADTVAVMYAGDIVERGPVDAIFARPAHPYTQGLLASTIHLETQTLASVPGAPPDLAAPPTGCRFHPRCARAREICASRVPPDVDMGDGQRALCWFPGLDADVKPQAPESEWGKKTEAAR
ncbi:MAG: ABC transporter ATP-binding protein [Thermoplasmatota archaeon]